jgi:hypothetical protein
VFITGLIVLAGLVAGVRQFAPGIHPAGLQTNVTSETEAPSAIDARSSRRIDGVSLAGNEPGPCREHISEADLPARLESLVLNPAPGAAELRQTLVRQWAEADPAAAALWAASLPQDTLAPDVFEQISIAWANSDLPAATQWLTTLAEGTNRNCAVLSAAYEAVRSEPVTALDLAMTLPVGLARDELLAHALSQYAAIDPEAAAAWAAKEPDTKLRQRLVEAVAVASAEQNPVAAASLAATALNPGPAQERAVVAIVQRWGQSAPEEAASWVSQFPDGPTRKLAAENLRRLGIAQ